MQVFTFSCLAITTLLFISTAIIFWASDYAVNVLHGDHDMVLIVFVVVCLTGPVAGIILGGAIVQKFAGGYEGKHSVTLCIIFAASAFACAIPVAFIWNVYFFGVCLWAILFLGGAIIPNIQGVMISSLDNNLRAAGNSVSNILQNLLGFLPAPFAYGLIYDNTKETNPRLAMTITLWYSSAGIFFLVLVYIFRIRIFKAKESINKVDLAQKSQSQQAPINIDMEKVNVQAS